jgi:hypothetical protein
MILRGLVNGVVCQSINQQSILMLFDRLIRQHELAVAKPVKRYGMQRTSELEDLTMLIPL